MLSFACYKGGFFAGHPCTNDNECGSLACIQGACGGSGTTEIGSSSTSESTVTSMVGTSTEMTLDTESTIGTTDTSSSTTVLHTSSTSEGSTTTLDTGTNTSISSASTTITTSTDTDEPIPTPEQICAEYCRVSVCCGGYVTEYDCDNQLVPQGPDTPNDVLDCTTTFCLDIYNTSVNGNGGQACGDATLAEFQCVGNLLLCNDYNLYDGKGVEETGGMVENWPCKTAVENNIEACMK